MIGAIIIAASVALPIVYFLVLLGVAIAFLKLNDWIFHGKRRKRKDNAESKSYDERLKTPAFDALERRFGHTFPGELKALYQDHEEKLKAEFDITSGGKGKSARTWHIAFYEPADLEHVVEAWPDAGEVFEFANDGCGNGYTIDPRLDNPPVKFFDHETGEWETVASSISEYLKMARTG